MESISKPTLILDQEKCQRNIIRMLDKLKAQGIAFRPHFKTHQSGHIGEWFSALGVKKITVSSLSMAHYFSQFGWQDITVAFPLNILELNQIRTLSESLNLGLLVLDPKTVDDLGKNTHHTIALWIKIDVGTHRTGLASQARIDIDHIIERIQHYPHLQFRGFLAHAGHSYTSRSVGEVESIYNESLRILIDLKAAYISNHPGIEISLGDTPGASMVEQLGEVDELRPGNFVFYDLMQEEIGACTLDDIAVVMACPVVAVHPDRHQWIIYGGAVHFSKEFLNVKEGVSCYGRMVDFLKDGWTTKNVVTNPYIASLSQEHGIVQCTEETFGLYQPGDLTFWLPVHSCLTADAMGSYRMKDGRPIEHYRRHIYD